MNITWRLPSALAALARRRPSDRLADERIGTTWNNDDGSHFHWDFPDGIGAGKMVGMPCPTWCDETGPVSYPDYCPLPDDEDQGGS